MTARQLFEYALIELNKVQAPSLILEDYNYFINKAVSQVINKIYNLFEINQQKTDDLRVLRSSAVLIPSVNSDFDESSLYRNIYKVYLPDDYLHILNCVIEFTFLQQSGCNIADKIINVGAKKLTSDSFPQLLNNYYFKPTYKNPYFYINNVINNSDYPVIDSLVDVYANAPYLETGLGIGNPEGNLYNINKGLYECSSNNFVRASISTNALELGTLNTFTTTFIEHARWSGETDSLFTIIGDSSTYFTDKNIKAGSLIVTTNTAWTDNSDPDNPIYNSAGVRGNAIVVDVITINGKEAIILDNDTNFLEGDYIYDQLYGFDSIVEFIGYNANINTAKKVDQLRYGNKTKVRMELRFGDKTNPYPSKVYVDYLRSPQFIKLTEEQVDNVEDYSQLIEFPDYVCQEILNELVKLLMENASDPRLQSNIPINQTIANPGQSK